MTGYFMQHQTIPHTTSVEMPDGTLVEVDLVITATYEKNPCDKEPEHYRGEDDGWVITDIALNDQA